MTPYFIATIWPHAFDRLDDIKAIIEENYKILEVKRVSFDMSWRDMVAAVYKDDHINKRNFKEKVAAMKKHPKEIVFIYIEVEDPAYRSKKNGRKISTTMEVLKKEIRAQMGGKNKPSKNPIHIVDRYEHSINFDKFLGSIT